MSEYQKIDFKSIYNNANDDKIFKEEKENARIATNRSLIVTVLSASGAMILENDFLVVLLWIITGFGVYLTLLWYSRKSENKNTVRRSHAIDEYRRKVPILSLIPNNVEFKEIGTIDVNGKSKGDVKNKLIKKAYLSRADMLVGYDYVVDSTSIVKGNRRRVKTNVESIHRMSAIAVKIIEKNEENE